MGSLAKEIQACVLRSFCPCQAMSFERFHSKFPRFQSWLDNHNADKSVILNIFPTFPETMTVATWNLFISYVRSEEGEEYRALCQHWPKCAKLCPEGCKRCYIKAAGTAEEMYVVDRMYLMIGCKDEGSKKAMESKYPENFGEYLMKEARKGKRLRVDLDSFLDAPAESQGGS